MAKPQSSPSDVVPERREALPFSRALPVIAGVLAGIVLRLLFSGRPGGMYATMLSTFIILAPFVVGAVTVYVAERSKRRNWMYYATMSTFAGQLFVVGTLVIMLEGLICAILIIPLFAVMAAIGGLLMGLICRLTDWPKRALYSFAALPLLLGAVEPLLPLPAQMETVSRSIDVQAPPERVWQQLLNAEAIQPTEMQQGWMYRIGVPLPLSGVTEQQGEVLVRTVRMGKAIQFEQVATEWQPRKSLNWTYRFSESSFPPAALDDHVKIGGHYFDLISTHYTLTPNQSGTRLSIDMRYRVSTQFNWYAEPLARWLIGDFSDVVLEFYRRRSEATPIQTDPS